MQCGEADRRSIIYVAVRVFDIVPALLESRIRTEWLPGLLHLNYSPSRAAAAFALGVFFGFSPFLGLQTLSALGGAFLLRLHRVAVFVGLNVNLPWIAAPWYAATTLVAARLLGIRLPENFRTQLDELFAIGVFSWEFWGQARTLLQPLLLPFLIGPTIGAAIAATLAYVIAVSLLRRRPAAVLSTDYETGR